MAAGHLQWRVPAGGPGAGLPGRREPGGAGTAGGEAADAGPDAGLCAHSAGAGRKGGGLLLYDHFAVRPGDRAEAV